MVLSTVYGSCVYLSVKALVGGGEGYSYCVLESDSVLLSVVDDLVSGLLLVGVGCVF